jgi:glycosyltransferase involved in cell wall biosynthesis
LREDADEIKADLVLNTSANLTIGVLILQYDKFKVLSNEQKKVNIKAGENRISYSVGRIANADTFKVRLNLGTKPCSITIKDGTISQVDLTTTKYSELIRLERRKRQVDLIKNEWSAIDNKIHYLNPINPDYNYENDRDGNKVLISIIVPVYNTSSYLARCLDSLLNQTIKDIEIIAVNDGSTDNSLSILKEYQNNYPSIIKIIDKVNGGLGMARNYGLNMAEGRFVMFLDSDDAYATDACEALYWHSLKFDCDMVYGRIGLEIDDKIVPQENLEKKIARHVNRRFSNLKEDTGTIFYNVVCTLYSREILNSNNIRFPEGIIWEDMPFAIQAWHHSKRIGCIPNIVYYRTIREDSLSRKTNYRQVRDRILITEIISKYFDKYQIHNMFNYFKWSMDDIEERLNNIDSDEDKKKAIELWSVEKDKMIKRREHHELLYKKGNRSLIRLLAAKSLQYLHVKSA